MKVCKPGKPELAFKNDELASLAGNTQQIAVVGKVLAMILKQVDFCTKPTPEQAQAAAASANTMEDCRWLSSKLSINRCTTRKNVKSHTFPGMKQWALIKCPP